MLLISLTVKVKRTSFLSNSYADFTSKSYYFVIHAILETKKNDTVISTKNNYIMLSTVFILWSEISVTRKFLNRVFENISRRFNIGFTC